MINTTVAHLTTYLDDAITDTTGYLDDCKLGLLVGTVPEGADTVFADLTFADFDGYAEATIATWVGPGQRFDLRPYVVSDDAVFTAGTVAEPQTVTGWALYTSTTLHHWGTFETPIDVDRDGQVVLVRAQVAMETQATGYADALTI